MEEGTLGKWAVNVGGDHDFVLDDDEDLEAEEGVVQLGGHGAEDEEEGKPNQKRNINKKSKEHKEHNGKSDKSSKDKSKSNPKKKHDKNREQEEQDPVVETGGFFEF